MKIHAIDRQGKEYTLEGREGWSVMEILRDGGLDIAAECGGACACATCHVYVNDGWYDTLPKPSEAEIDMLDMALAVEPNSKNTQYLNEWDWPSKPRLIPFGLSEKGGEQLLYVTNTDSGSSRGVVWFTAPDPHTGRSSGSLPRQRLE